MEQTKPTAAEVAQLRAEMRKRKILERGDERLRKLCGESKDETHLSRTESVEERNKNLIEQIIKDPNVMERINSLDKVENGKFDTDKNGLISSIDNLDDRLNDNQINSSKDNSDDNLVNSSKESSKLISPICTNGDNIVNQEESKSRPLIDLSYFEQLEKKQKLRQERLEISRVQLFLINLVNIITLKKDEILINLFKIMIACLASYFSFNIVTPFLLSQSIVLFYTDFMNELNNLTNFKLSYAFIKNILLDSFNFLFIYIIIQALTGS